MKRLLIILQNAYGVEDGFVPTYNRKIFACSHTGRRLKNAIPENISVEIINASPLVGKESSANFKPDVNYVKSKCLEIMPDVVLACGVNARKVTEKMNLLVPIIYMPHPAYRALENKTLLAVREEIESIIE